mmetsp:Transcript_18239/g.40037  ORF Transcript_18239/g.40037 Transcript_18239/m.40037 type:complete len:211 (+) Transcript_18239:617-1249(+)
MPEAFRVCSNFSPVSICLSCPIFTPRWLAPSLESCSSILLQKSFRFSMASLSAEMIGVTGAGFALGGAAACCEEEEDCPLSLSLSLSLTLSLSCSTSSASSEGGPRSSSSSSSWTFFDEAAAFADGARGLAASSAVRTTSLRSFLFVFPDICGLRDLLSAAAPSRPRASSSFTRLALAPSMTRMASCMTNARFDESSLFVFLSMTCHAKG